MVEKPVVTVLMTVYNAELYLSVAIESILGQTFSDFELIVINDGSIDSSGEILEDYCRKDSRLKMVHQENRGIYIAANRGFELAKGKFLARMDADDIAQPERLQKQVATFEKDPSLVMIGSAYELIRENGDPIRIDRMPISDTEIRWHLLFDNAFAQSTVMLDMDVLRNNQLIYDPGLQLTGDYELWSKLVKYGKAQNLPIPFVKRRFHERQVSETRSALQQEIATQVSQHNLKSLGVDVTIEQVEKLRAWVRRFPRVILPEDIGLCDVMLEILNRFSGLPGIDPKVLETIKGRWILKLLTWRTPSRNSWRWKYALIRRLNMSDYLCVGAYLRQRILDRR